MFKLDMEKAKEVKLCPTLSNPMDGSPSGSYIHGVFQARILSGLPFSSPGDPPDPGIILGSPTLQADSLPAEPPGNPNQRSNCQYLLDRRKSKSSRKTSTFALLTMTKPLTVYHKKLWKILKVMGISDHLTWLLRNLYAGQEATVRTGHGTIHWFQIGKGVHQGCILSPCLFNLYAEYIMRNAGLEEAQTGI